MPSAVVYRMLPKALWESVRAQGSAQKNAQAGIQAGVGFQVSTSGVPGGNLFFFLPSCPYPSACPAPLHLRSTAVSLRGKGRSPLLSTRRTAVLAPPSCTRAHVPV